MRLKLLLITIALFVGFGSSYGQTPYVMSGGNYSQTFTGLSTAYPTNFNGLAILATGTIPVATKTTTATNGALPVVGTSTALGYDAILANSTKMIFLCTGPSDNTAAVACDLNLDFTGRAAGSLSFNYANILNASVASPNGRASSLMVYYSTDGTNWTSLGGPYTVYNTTGASTANVPVSITLPAALNNQATVKLRFYEYNGGTIVGSPSGNRPKISLDDIGVTSTAAFITQTSGDWNIGSTWVGGVVPTSAQNVIIAHNVTTVAVTRDSGTTTTINSGVSLAVSGTYTNNGATTVNGSFQLDGGGWVSDVLGTNSLVYGSNGTLIFNSTYTANNGNYWPTTSGPVNVTVNSGNDLTLGFSRTVSGSFQTSAGVNLSSSTLTLNGIAKINAGGYFNQSPIYGSASTLIYNTGGTFGRGLEWSALGVGTIGTTEGYPNNIQLSGNTTLNYNNGTPLAKAINGNLTIDLGSNFYMDYGGGASGGILTVAGNIVNNGIFKLGYAIGDDLVLKGNWTNSGTFTPNTRLVTFNGASAQTLTGATTFDYLTLNNSLGLTLQASSAVTVNQTLAYTSGRITIGANNLNVGSAGTITGYSSSNYVVTASTGKLVKQGVGNTATVFPIGFSTTNYTPVTLTNTTGTSDLSVSVKQSVTNAVTDATRIVTLEWGVTSSGATAATISPTWEAVNQAASFTNTGTGELGNYTTAYTTYPVTLSTTTTTATGIPLQSGTNLIVVGNTGDVYTTPPANDLCFNAIPLTLNATATTGNLKGSTPTAGLTYSATSKDVWYSFTPSCTGTFAITVTGFTGDVDMDVFTASCPTSGVGTSTSHGSTTTETVSPTLTSGTTYFIRVLGYNATAEKSAFTIQVTNSGTLTLANTGSPAAGNISANTNDVVIFGFNVTPNTCTTSYDFTQVIITKTGTTTTSDLSNFRIVYDADGDGVFDIGESSVSGLGIALANTMTFTMSGQTVLSAARRYLLVADVAVLATGGNTFTGKITPSTNLTASLTPTGTVFGTATGNTQTIIYNGPEINVTNNTPSSIPTGSTANAGYNTIFAATAIGASTAAKTYRIYNLGSTTLNVSSVTANNTEFAVTASAPYTIAPGSFGTFTVVFSPLNMGTRAAVISIANNDITNDGALTENPYTFNVQGTGNCPTTTNTITTTSGPAGTEVTITSSNSATNNLTGATATFNGINAIIISSTATKLVVLVPPLAKTGNLITTNATGCQATNAFTVIDNKANSCQGGTIASDLFISEVTDSNSGGLTYVEIYNGTGSTVNLSTYHIDFYNNGSLTLNGGTVPFGNVNLLSGNTFTIAIGVEGSPYTYTCSGQNNQYNGSLANLLSGISGVNFNTGGENDHIKLFKSATQIDSWGEYENGYWANGLGIGTEGATFRRKNTASLVQPITYSNSDWDITDWTACANNDYSDIGTYNFISGSPPTVTTHPSYTPTCKATSLTVTATEGYNGSSPADTMELTYKWLYASPVSAGWTEIASDGGIYTGTATATLNISNISTIINYQYYCQIRENTNTCYTASNAVKIIDGTITWNGTDWRDVNNAITTPSLSKLAVINANYNTTTNSSFSACSVVVYSPYTLTITADEYVKIQNDLTNNGVVTIKNDGSLVQVNDSGTNTGVIRYERTTPKIFRTDYTYWSSPLAGYTLGGVSQNLTLEDKYYSYDSSVEDWQQESATTLMSPGLGYIIRGPESPFWEAFSAFFIGVPNNGEYIITGITPDKSYLLGNPYTSALDADTFLEANSNVLDGTLYFWTHKTPLSLATSIPNPGPGWAYTYSLNDYAAYNPVGGVGIDDVAFLPGGSPAPNGSAKPTGKIASGQGFFASSKTPSSGSSIIYNNSMRVGVVDILKEDNTQFFKTRSPKTKLANIEKHRIWLNLKNTQGAFKQTLIGYITDATNEYDSRFDGESFDANEFVDFYSLNQDKNLVIQGRALPFDENDEVPLGYRTTIEGAFTINIDQVDGVLTNQAVFIEDKLTNTVFDLKGGNYTFNTVAGTFNDRFILRYTNKTLGTADLETLENQVLISNKNKQIKVISAVETIDKVLVYDLLGRQIYKKEKISSNELTIPNLVSSQQTLLVKVTLQNGQTVTKKIIF